MPHKKNIYGVYDGDKLLFQGTNSEIYEKFEMKTTSLYGYCYRGWKINRQFTVKLIEQIDSYKGYQRKTKPKNTMSKFEQVIDYAIRHLELYGNTILPEDRHTEEYLKELENRGYRCELKDYYNYGGENITLENSTYHKRQLGVDHIIRWLDYDRRKV